MDAIQKHQTDGALAQVVNPYQLEVARKLSRNMANTQAQEILASDILYKIGNLVLIQSEIVQQTPEALAYTDYVIRAFTYLATESLK